MCVHVSDFIFKSGHPHWQIAVFSGCVCDRCSDDVPEQDKISTEFTFAGFTPLYYYACVSVATSDFLCFEAAVLGGKYLALVLKYRHNIIWIWYHYLMLRVRLF